MSDDNDRKPLSIDPTATLELVAANYRANAASLRHVAERLGEDAALAKEMSQIVRATDAVLQEATRFLQSTNERMRAIAATAKAASDDLAAGRDHQAAAAHFRNAVAALNAPPPARQRIPSLPGAPGYRAPAVPPPVPRLPPPRRPRPSARHVPPAPGTKALNRPAKSREIARLDSLIGFPSLGTPRRGSC